MAIANSPITLFAMEKSSPLGALLAAGERLSNLAYHIATNKGAVDERLRGEFDICRKAWDDAASEYAVVLRAKSDVPSGADLIAAERVRQVTAEGWTAEHDDTHVLGELSLAGAVYASVASALCRGATVEEFQDAEMMIDASDWPFESACWKPTSDPIRNLEKAGAFLAAEIDRLKRARSAAPKEAS